MGRISVTDGMDESAVKKLENAGHEVILKHYSVCNTPSSSTNAVVELTIGHLISCTRKIAIGDRSLRERKWAKKNLRGSELSGKRLGLIGFGRISQGVGKIARSLGMSLHTYDPYLPPEVAADQHCTLHDEIDKVFQLCTHISIHCNHSDETHHLVNKERLEMMPGIGIDGVECGNHLVRIGEEMTSLILDFFERKRPKSILNPEVI